MTAWPLAQRSEAVEAIARAKGWTAVEGEAVLIRDSDLAALGPSLIIRGDELHAVLATNGRRARVLTPDGERTSIPLSALATSNEQPATIHVLRPPIDDAKAIIRDTGIVRGSISFAVSQLAQTLLLMGSWWILGLIAFGTGPHAGLFLLWLLVSLTMLPLRWFGTAAGRTAALETGALLKRRLLAGALKLEPDEVHGRGMGSFLAHVMEASSIENLGSHAATIGLTGIVTAIGTLVALSLGAGGVLHTLLFLLFVVIAGAITVRFYSVRDGWTEGRFALTGRIVENLAGHRTRLVQKAPETRTEGEDALLADYIAREEALNRTALALDMLRRAWPWVGLAGIAPQLVAGGYDRAAMALSIGGILFGGMALNSWMDGGVMLAAAAVAWKRVKTFWKTAARTRPAGTAAAQAAVERPASPGIPLLEASSLTFRHRGRERPTLDEATLRIEEGDRILLGGHSGAGKTTLSMVLSGGRPLQNGLLFFRGLDVPTVGVEEWRRRVLLAPQFYANHIFSGSLAYNLLLGRNWPASPDEYAEAEAVCRELGLGALLDKMPLGLEQPVGETGWQLSHGERTRVFLARALLQQPALTILDETFAALDPETLQEAMGAVLARHGAVMVIAHT